LLQIRLSFEIIGKKIKHTSRLDPADDDVVDFIVSNLLVTTSKHNNTMKTKYRYNFKPFILAAELALRETAVRLSLSPSLPKKTHAHAYLSTRHILCPDKLVFRGNVTFLSGVVKL